VIVVQKTRWFLLAGVVAALLSLAVMVAACDGGEENGGAEPTATEPAVAEPTVTEPAETEPADGDSTRIEIAAENVAFDTGTLEVPAGEAFTIVFNNNDSGVSHSFAIYESQEAAEGDDDPIAATEITSGPDAQELPIATLDADEYFFWCDVHQLQMSGTVVAQ